jgi:hypothetical protein
MESVTMDLRLQERLEQVFLRKALPKNVLSLDRMPLGELLYFAVVESAEGLVAQA